MNKAHLVSVHEAGIAHHVATVGEINGQNGTAAILDGARPVVMKFLIIVCINVATREHLFDMRQELDVNGHHVFEMAVNRTIFYHPDLTVTLNDLSLN